MKDRHRIGLIKQKTKAALIIQLAWRRWATCTWYMMLVCLYTVLKLLLYYVVYKYIGNILMYMVTKPLHCVCVFFRYLRRKQYRALEDARRKARQRMVSTRHPIPRKPHPSPHPPIGTGPLEERDSCSCYTVIMEKISEKKTVTQTIEEDKSHTRLDAQVREYWPHPLLCYHDNTHSVMAARQKQQVDKVYSKNWGA